MRTLRAVDRIGARELRANLAAALRQAGTGERVVITVDGRAVAQLGPVEPAGAPTLEELAASGLVDPPRRADRPEAPAALDAAVDVRLDRVLAEVRGG
jgi:prevent-host-death family protein